MKLPTSCYLARCAGAMEGQMLACAAHWSFLSGELRLGLVAAWDQLWAENKAGNIRRATREAWRALVVRAAAEWEAARRDLEQRSGQAVGPTGGAWLRAQRALERAAVEAEAGPSEGDVSAADNLMSDGELWKERTDG